MKHVAKYSLLLVSLFFTHTILAKTLKVGLSSEPTSVDPYFHNLTPNNVVAYNVFETLIYMDSKAGVSPRLATSWQQLPDNKLLINLRKGVKFHDGSDFTANDVVYSACRISRVKNSPSSLASEIAEWKDIEVVNDHQIIVTKVGPAPLLLPKAENFFILSDSIAGNQKVNFNEGKCDGFNYVETIDFETGKAAIGTGPYQLSTYIKGEKIIYNKFANYWGNGHSGANAPAGYDVLELRPIKSPGSRVAAMISGDVDMIEAPPVQDLKRLNDNPDIRIASSGSNRTIYVMFNMRTEVPDVEGTNGKNPFLDKRVREAMSLAINRTLIVDRIMGPLGIAATNIAPQGIFGMESVKGYQYDVAKAKRLLKEAGYPKGFTITFGSPNDRYINDAKVAQAIAQMWAQIGIKTKVTAVTRSVFFGNRNKGVYPIWLAGWGDSLFDGESFVRALSATANKEKKWGASNKGGYSNPDIDALVDKIVAEADNNKRRALIAKAAAMVLEEKNWFATHYQIFPIALHKSVSYNPPAGGERVIFRVLRPAK